ncbi:MAG: PD40 domain-containing protein, partial [Caldisericaceae bacterium]|nr:PD40 domain-containing protein [Caldisericaceae bacterium]
MYRQIKIHLTLILIVILWLVSCDKKEILEPQLGDTIHELTDSIPYSALGSGTIVFQRTGSHEIYHNFYVMDVDQKKTWPIKPEEENAFYPKVSPDGQKIVYSMFTNMVKGYDIHLMDIDGSNNKNISNLEDNEYFPCWSPDGRSIFYSTSKNIIFSCKKSENFQEKYRVYELLNKQEIAPASNFSISSNNEIAFILPRSFNYVGLCLLNIADQDVSWLVEQPQDIFFESPAFSPDGQFIAYISCSTTDSTLELVLFDVKNESLKTIFTSNFQ